MTLKKISAAASFAFIFSAIALSCTSVKTFSKDTGLIFDYPIPQDYTKANSCKTNIPHASVKNIPKNIESLRENQPEAYIDHIARIINSKASSDYEKVKMAYDYIAMNIKYDAHGYWNNSFGNQDWQNVLKTKTAVAQGYSNLFLRLCREINIRCVQVSGYARGVGFDISQTENPNRSNHAWNLVEIEDVWFIVDPAWGAGYIDGKKFVPSYTTDWLFVYPKAFICTHYTSSKKKQMLENPYSSKDFCNLAYLKPKYFDITGIESTLPQILQKTADEISIEYPINCGYTFSAIVTSVNTQTIIQNSAANYSDSEKKFLKINFTENGLYKIHLYYFPANQRTGYDCGAFFVEANITAAKTE